MNISSANSGGGSFHQNIVTNELIGLGGSAFLGIAILGNLMDFEGRHFEMIYRCCNHPFDLLDHFTKLPFTFPFYSATGSVFIGQ